MADIDKGAVGRDAEQRALDYLLARRLRLVTRNFRSRFGEIDLVMRDGDCLVFVEVRYRNANHFASALESVDRRKQAKLVRAAAFYVSRYRRSADRPMRFDVVAIDASGGSELELCWLKDAFRPGD